MELHLPRFVLSTSAPPPPPAAEPNSHAAFDITRHAPRFPHHFTDTFLTFTLRPSTLLASDPWVTTLAILGVSSLFLLSVIRGSLLYNVHIYIHPGPRIYKLRGQGPHCRGEGKTSWWSPFAPRTQDHGLETAVSACMCRPNLVGGPLPCGERDADADAKVRSLHTVLAHVRRDPVLSRLP
ncbi:hypothetical protein SODALDRAFT_363682 [Sodiomyces alkalinus F11]|uniref:Uncharacterized protein n=1 Tax=Sodiomyces alkalinus (strain CBS 110278 / VKM F-3762 / F11) TaxID=1314773 RepID=A0A3N2PKF1_SODAK|nr:hypothetical protein SODALDRAFT_363682 [Sodiomyces alkalinus F11]ROT34985.1 hypothetical protein SODALDRAFT_363682 [Sodiomyces alkalinus F11]